MLFSAFFLVVFGLFMFVPHFLSYIIAFIIIVITYKYVYENKVKDIVGVVNQVKFVLFMIKVIK